MDALEDSVSLFLAPVHEAMPDHEPLVIALGLQSRLAFPAQFPQALHGGRGLVAPAVRLMHRLAPGAVWAGQELLAEAVQRRRRCGRSSGQDRIRLQRKQ